MRKFLTATLFLVIFTFSLCGCFKKIDYTDYVSESRTTIYIYCDDEISVKIYCGNKESPYCADGIKGKVESFTEILVKFLNNPKSVNITCDNICGEMNYNAVKNAFYLSDGVKIPPLDDLLFKLEVDGKAYEYKATNVTLNGVISKETALNCVIEYDGETFEQLTEHGLFNGEIFIRILYDEGCYYYVGVCDTQGKIKAYLLDGVYGKIIAERNL
ncbi:MAG: hypothetical protein J6B04_05930 [Clostridia bacterium]|nr:hypothetical protein [Clostridia bacterium]